MSFSKEKGNGSEKQSDYNMGRETKTFRQTKRAGGADNSNKNYARINRQGGWGKVLNVFRFNKKDYKNG